MNRKSFVAQMSSMGLLSAVSGLLSFTLGAMVLLGWYTNNAALIQVNPNFVPMQYNTALGFVLAGVSVYWALTRQRWYVYAFAGTASLIGMLTLVQYIFGLDLGIDQLFMEHYIDVNTSHPGRMAPNTALCFSLTGLALLIAVSPFSIRYAIAGTLGSVIFALGLVAFVGYLTSVETAYGWGALTKMAVHTSLGFMLLGAGILCLGIHHFRVFYPDTSLASWLGWPTGIFGLTCTGTMWQAILSHERALVDTAGVQMGYAGDSMLIFGLLATLAAVMMIYQSRSKGSAEPKKNLHLRHLIVGVLGVVLAVSIYQLLHTNFQARVKQEFQSEVKHRGRAVIQALTLYLEVLHHARTLFISSNEVSRLEFQLMAQNELERYPGIRSIHWLPKISAESISQHEQALKALTKGQASITRMTLNGGILPVGEKGLYFPISYIEPFVTDSIFVGVDSYNSNVFSTPDSLREAIKEDRLVASKPLNIGALGGEGLTVQFLLPVYNRTVYENHAKKNEESVLGFVGVLVTMEGLIKTILERHTVPAGLNLTFTDVSDPNNPIDVHEYKSRIQTEGEARHVLVEDVPLKMGDRRWLMRASSASNERYPSHSLSNLVPPATILLIAFSVAMIMRQINRREKERSVFLEAIARREQHFSALVNTIPGAAYTCLLDADWTMKFLSKNAESLTGYPSDEFIQNRVRTWAEIMHPEDRAAMSEQVEQAVIAHEAYTLEYRIIQADGNIAWVFEKGQAIYDEQAQPLELHGTVLDITDRKMLEGKFQGLLEAAPDSIIIVNGEGEIGFVNKQAEQMFGYKKDELLGQKVERLLPPGIAAGHPLMRDSYFRDPSVRAMGSGRELVAVTASGASVPVEISLSPMRSEEGLLVFAAVRDITERRKMERELIASKERAEEATAAKGEFLANMSHEIRTPMNAIIGMSELALETDLSPTQHNYIHKVHRSAEALLGIINDILDFSKIEAGKLNIEEASFRIEDVLDNLANILSFKAEEKGLELLFDVPIGLPSTLIGDPLRIGQILINLGNNAIKFTDSGEVVIAISLIGQSVDTVNLAFSVKDTGIGIPEAKRESLFQSFTQADTSTTRKFGGTGLGLTISKSLVEMMGGELSCESEEGLGSEFRFRVSFKISEQEIVRAKPQEIDAMRVLIADDNSSSRTIIGSVLRGFGLRVDEVPSGIEALDAAKKADDAKDPYELVVMDWKMPKMDGIETTRKLQSESQLEAPPTIIMVTAFGREAASQAANDVQIHGLLTKPITPSTLLDSILTAKGHINVTPKRSDFKVEEVNRAINKLRGAHVLLVEDNDINMELAVDVLEKHDIRVSTAENGQLALDLLASKTFDGVLMDCQMPVLDGYETTKLIRENVKYEELPVLAMTANAMAGDKEKVLAAGMNDHIPKPLQRGELFLTMSRWISPAKPMGPRSVSQPNEGHAVTDKFPAIAGLNVAIGLDTCQNNIPLYTKLLGKFSAKGQGFQKEFEGALRSDDARAPMRSAHTLKGVAGNIGALAVQQEAANLELLCSDHADDAKVQESLRAVVSKLETVTQAIDKYLSSISEKDEMPESVDFDHEMKQLAILVSEFDTEALELVERLTKASLSEKQQVLVSGLIEHLESFDFDGAETLLSQWQS